MSALYPESTLLISFPGKEQGIALPCIEVEIKPQVEMRGVIQSEGVGRIEVELKIKTNNHELLSALSYDNTAVAICIGRKDELT